MELDDTIYAKIVELSARGDDLAARKLFGAAIACYEEALALVPDPVTEWEAATWLLAAIGDAYYLQGNLEEARMALQEAMHCPGAIGNPFLHLRLGEVQYDLGNMARAQDELVRAWMAEGDELFVDEDAKYLALVKSVTLPSLSGGNDVM
jgi:tetratricopeptide (TPR) repeat protein